MEASSLCLECVFTPCLCTLLHIERKIASLIVIKDLVNEIVEKATVRKKVERKRKREEENSEDEAYKEKQVQVYKVDGHSECGSSHSLCPSQKFVQSERVPQHLMLEMHNPYQAHMGPMTQKKV